MEKLIESRGQYDELRYKVGEELRMIQNVNIIRCTTEIGE